MIHFILPVTVFHIPVCVWGGQMFGMLGGGIFGWEFGGATLDDTVDIAPIIWLASYATTISASTVNKE